MLKTLHTLLFLSAFLLVACGKSDEQPPIKVNEAKVPKPTDESGNVEMKERTFTVRIVAPTPAWAIKISEIWVVGSEVWVLSDLSQKKGDMVAQVMTEISDSVTAEAPDIEAVYYVIGSTGGWQPKAPGIKLIFNKDQIAKDLKEGFQIWPKK